MEEIKNKTDRNENNVIVAVKRCSSYDTAELKEALEGIFKMMGGLENHIRSAKRILLKPNLLSPTDPSLAVTTHPDFIEAVIHAIKKARGDNCNIIIADSPGVSTPHTRKDLKNLYKVCGLLPLEKIKGVTLNLDTSFSKAHFKDAKVLKQLEIINPVLDADFVINLPKFKTHSLTRVSGAVKNMYGTIHGRTKTLLHAKFIDIEQFNDMLLDVYLANIPGINIMDGILGLEGEGPGASGKPRHTGLILAGTNAIAVDSVMASIMGFESSSIPLIRCAEARGLPGTKPGDIEIWGGSIEEFKIADYRRPRSNPLDTISKSRFLKSYVFPFIRNTLSLSPYQNKAKCTMCNTCIEICPEKAVIAGKEKLIFDYKKCIRCFCCSEMCQYGAVDLKYSFLGNLIFGRKKVK